MKKVNETPEPKRLLIHVDNDLHKRNKKVLDEIITETGKIKASLLSLDLNFTRETFVKLQNEGIAWINDELYRILAADHKGKSDKIIAASIEVALSKLQSDVKEIEPGIVKIRELLSKIDLTPEQVPFNEKSDPFVNAELKLLLSEKSKRWAEKDEIPVYHALTKFIAAVNEFEQFIAKTPYPSLIGIPGVRLHEFLENNFFYQFPYFNIDTDDCDNLGYCELKLNPELFEDFRANMKINTERQNLENEMRSLPPEVRFHENRITDIPAASFKLPRDAGKQIDDKNPVIKKNKPNWGDLLKK